MTLAQVQGFTMFVLALIATWGGLLLTTALLFPVHTKRAEYALETDPKKSFLKGLGVLALLIFSLVLQNLPFPLIKLAAFGFTLLLLGIVVLGGAGTAHLMGRRISEMQETRTSFFSLASGSVVYSLAIGFPIIGWFLFAPIALVFAMGAGWSAIRTRHKVIAPPVTPAPSYDLH